MKLFESQTNTYNFIYPIVKIILSIVVIFVCIFRKQLINIEVKWLNVILSIASFVVVIIGVIIIYISLYEIFNMFEHKTNNKIQDNECQQMHIDEIIKLVDDNDIIEIAIKSSNNVIRLGSSSDCKNGSNVFFDKKYYCGNKQYDSLSDFYDCVIQYATNDLLYVVSIDDICLTK